MKFVVISIFLVFSNCVFGIEVEPYETPKISVERWNKYHESTSTELAETRRSYDTHKLELFSDDKTRASIAFTMPGHKAHPSWVTRQVEMKGGAMNMKVVGFYAGDEEAFKILFGQYQEMANQTRKQFQR